MLTASSGALVPKATTVKPTISGGTPNDAASFAAPETRRSAPATSSTKPSGNVSQMESPKVMGDDLTATAFHPFIRMNGWTPRRAARRLVPHA